MYPFSDSIYGDYHCEVSSVILWLKWFVWIIHDNSCISFTWQVLWVQSHFSLTKVKMMPVLSYCSSLEYSLHCANNTKMKPKERTTSGIINQSSFVRIFQLYFFTQTYMRIILLFILLDLFHEKCTISFSSLRLALRISIPNVLSS